MAQTLAEIRAELEADPRYAALKDRINKADVPLSAAERAARLDTWASAEHQRQLEVDAEATRKTLRQQARNHIATLDAMIADANVTNTEAVAYIKDLARGQKRIIQVLMDRLIIEPTD